MMPNWLGALLMAITAATVAAYVADRYTPARDEVVRLERDLRSQTIEYVSCRGREDACRANCRGGGGL